MVTVALTIAGTDPSGGAGIVADCRAFEAAGVWAAACVTAVTAQNTRGVQLVRPLDVEVVRAQLDSVGSDLTVGATKTGMLGSASIVDAVADAIGRHRLGPLVVDPVCVSSSGTTLLDAAGVAGLRSQLVPLATLVTPNLAEAAMLTGLTVDDRDDMVSAGRMLCELGAGAALVTGGHLVGDVVADVLVVAGEEPTWFVRPRLSTRHTHGTGCCLAASITARLALGLPLHEAVALGIATAATAIAHGVDLGAGDGSVDAAWHLRSGA